jgi:hypothetical protein
VRLIRINILIEIVVQVYIRNIIGYLSEEHEEGRECTNAGGIGRQQDKDSKEAHSLMN